MLLITAICLVVAFPIYWMLLNILQPSEASSRFPPPFIPEIIDLTSIGEVMNDYPIATWLMNSVILAVIATVLCLVLTVFGAYALSVLRWRLRSLFGLLLLLTQMLPEVLLLIPIYQMYRTAGLVDNLIAIAFIHVAFAMPIAIWILKNVFDTVPREISEATMVDGGGHGTILFRVLVPIAFPGIVAVCVVTAFYSWNEFLFASTLISSEELRPASVGLSTLISQHSAPIQRLLAAGLAFSILPVVFLVAAQRYLVSGATSGAVK